MKRDYRTSGMARSYYPELEGNLLTHGSLIEILTSIRNRKDMIRGIRAELSMNKDNPRLSELHKAKLDVAIVVFVQSWAYERQDTDNLAKTILDALKKPNVDDGLPYFFEDDRQIVRLLVYKKKRMEDPEHNTCQLAVSIRKHDSDREMVLVVKVSDEKGMLHVVPVSQFDKTYLATQLYGAGLTGQVV